MREFKVREDVLVEVLKYLTSKPFQEVAGLIKALETSQVIQPAEEAKEAKEKVVADKKPVPTAKSKK